MEYNDRKDLSSISDDCDDVQSEVFLTFEGHCQKFIICEIYRPPRSSIPLSLENMHLLLPAIARSGSLSYIMGDLNINLLGYPESTGSLELLNLFLMFAFMPVVNRPTRTVANSIILNVIFTNESLTYILTCTISDHFLITHSVNAKITIDNANTSDYAVRTYLIDSNLCQFRNILTHVDWSEITSNQSLDQDFAIFCNTFFFSQTNHLLD